jgi:hypothetical protein
MLPRLFFVATALAILPGAFPKGVSPAPVAQAEEELLARIQKERSPVRKAKLEIRLGRVKLHQAIAAYDQGSVERGAELLGAYVERMKSAWQTLRDSGREAARQPQGFKELDIALREDARLIEDLKHRLPYLDRGVVEKAGQEIERVRAEVLRALFPAERPPARGKNSVRLGGRLGTWS